MFYVTCYSVQDVLAKMLKEEEEEDREKEYEKNREAKERTKMDEEDKEGQKRRMEEIWFGDLCYLPWVDGK